MRLIRYALRRVLLLIPVLLTATFIAFFLTRIVPGNPIDRVVSPYASAEQRAEMRHAARLDRPFYVQFVLYLGDLARGDLGTSYTTAQPVARDLRERLGATLELVLGGMLLALLAGVPLGLLGALTRDRLPDQIGRVVAVLGVSLPVFWLALMLLFVLFYQLGLAPAPLGRIPAAMEAPPTVSGLYTLDALLAGDGALLAAALRALMLPVLTLGLTALAPIARMTRASMIDALASDYVRTAVVLGLPRRVVVLRHALTNALVPILTISAAVFGYALGGEVLIEYIFSWPGLGQYAFNAIMGGDFPAIQGFILLVTTAYVLIYLAVDLASAAIDPRIEL